jgi:hypothetical protein
MVDTVFLAICHYTGCEFCGDGGSHVLGAFSTREKATTVAEDHERHKGYIDRTLDHNPVAHYGHFFHVDVEEFEVDVVLDNVC